MFTDDSMYLVYLTLLLAAVLAMNWSFLGFDRLFGGRRDGGAAPRARSTCKWKRDPMQKDGKYDRWICTKCGVDYFSTSGRAPDTCKRHLRDPGL